jgi:hypothetical protein
MCTTQMYTLLFQTSSSPTRSCLSVVIVECNKKVSELYTCGLILVLWKRDAFEHVLFV